MLALIEMGLRAANISSRSLDKLCARSGDECRYLVQAFQNPRPGSTPVPVFLMSNRVAGAGLKLTAADRMVILDKAWNPLWKTRLWTGCIALVEHGMSLCIAWCLRYGGGRMYRGQVFKTRLSHPGLEPGEQGRCFD